MTIVIGLIELIESAAPVIPLGPGQGVGVVHREEVSQVIKIRLGVRIDIGHRDKFQPLQDPIPLSTGLIAFEHCPVSIGAAKQKTRANAVVADVDVAVAVRAHAGHRGKAQRAAEANGRSCQRPAGYPESGG